MWPNRIEFSLIKLLIAIIIDTINLPPKHFSFHEHIGFEINRNLLICARCEMEVLQDPRLISDANSSIRSVPRDHADINACLVAFLNRSWYLRSQGVFNSHECDEC